jgi:hypothetical protein
MAVTNSMKTSSGFNVSSSSDEIIFSQRDRWIIELFPYRRQLENNPTTDDPNLAS